MSNVTRFGPSPLLDDEVATKAYVDAGGGGGNDIGCKVRDAAAISTDNNVVLVVPWDTEVYDTDGMHDNVTNNERITFKTAGKYLVIFDGIWASDSVGVRLGRIGINAIRGVSNRVPAITSSEFSMSVILDAAVDDFVFCDVLQASGCTLDFRSNVQQCSFSAQKIDAGG